MRSDTAVRAQVETYYDAVPRLSARVETVGPLTLFVNDGGTNAYYGRPTLGQTRALTAEDVRMLLDRQRSLELPQSLEWVAEVTPSLEAAAHAAGLHVSRHPLMIFDSAVDPGLGPETNVTARVLDADDPALATAIAAAHLAFAEPGTAIGHAGRAELANKTAELRVDGWLVALAHRIAAGHTVVAAAFDRLDPADPLDGPDTDGDRLAVASGQHNPVAATTEIVGVGTLPVARRRGLAQVVTRVLVAHARSSGIETIFLSAGDDDVARIYSRIGFRRIGTALIAQGPPTA